MTDPKVLQQVNVTETYIARRLWTGMKLINYSELSQGSTDTDVHVDKNDKAPKKSLSETVSDEL